MTNTQLSQQLSNESPAVQAEAVRINTHARHRALQIALLVPIIAALLGFFVSLRMLRLPDPESSGSVEGMAFG
jgi:hypothetical protein